MPDYGAWPGNLEVRQEGGARLLTGVFEYNSLAVVNDRGRVRKETILSHAFDFAINREPERRLDVLVGHDFGKPIASRQSGTLEITSDADAVRFAATLPDNPPSWVVDMERAVAAGIMTGLSPGFRVPPRSTVPDAEDTIPEPGNPSVSIRRVREAVLREMSVVTSGAYIDAYVDLRDEEHANGLILIPRRLLTWL